MDAEEGRSEAKKFIISSDAMRSSWVSDFTRLLLRLDALEAGGIVDL